MEKIGITAFHGFLGEPWDWETVKSSLKSDVNFNADSLLNDWQLLSDDPSFESWAHEKNQKRTEIDTCEILLGYSLGGRMIMHLDLSKVDAVILIGSHPGLCEGREVRLKQDQRWTAKASELSQKEWLVQWNDQPVFQKDQVRPKRSYSEDEFKTWMQIMDRFSLGRQKPVYSQLREHRNKIFWICGEEDKKFMALKPQMEEELGADHVFTVPGAGHGVIFDKPQAVAELVDQVVSYVG